MNFPLAAAKVSLKSYLVISNTDTELQIRGAIKDNSKIIFLISQRKHML